MPIARFLAILLLTVAVSLPSAAVADSDESLQAEYDGLFLELLKTPNDLDRMARYAYLATRFRDYEAAIGVFERMLLINPNLPTVRLEIGVLYYRLRSFDTAKPYLESALDDPTTPPTAKDRARRYLDEVEQRLARHSFSGAVLAGVRYQSNANAGPGSAAVLAGGFPAVLSDFFQSDNDTNGFVSGRIRHRYNLDTPLDEAWVTDGLFYGAKQIDRDELDVGFMELRTGPRVAILSRGVDGLFLQPFFLGRVTFLDADIYGQGYGGGVAVEKEDGEESRYGLRYTGVYQTFKDPSALFFPESSDGVEHAFSAYFFERLTDDLSISGWARYTDEQALSPHRSFDRVDVRGRISYLYDAPFGITSWPWQISLGGGFIYRRYDAPDPAVDPFTRRRDEEYRVSLSNDFQVSRDWSVLWRVQYIDVDSNLPNFTYKNLQTLIALKKRF